MIEKLTTIEQMRAAALRASALSAEVALAAAEAVEEVELAKQNKPVSVRVTLPANGWDARSKTQSASVPGVSADEAAQLIQAMPSAASQAAYLAAGILCTGQGADSLTFTAGTAPAEDLTVYVVIQEVRA